MNDFKKPFFMSSYGDRPGDMWDASDDFGGPAGPGPIRHNYRNMGPWRGSDDFGGGGPWSRYEDAYGDYQGGYGPDGGFGPPRGFGPGPDFEFSDGPGFRPGYGPGPSFRPGYGYGPGVSYGQGPTSFSTGRGYGPSGPPVRSRNQYDERVIGYLLRCGVARENLKNLPREFLQLIEPQSCGLCGHHFESFAISRTHYSSKNHLKKQKKWLTDFNEGSLNYSKEVPFKSRDLYCEICDVHITSKAHAESHYTGKPHRAIIEGRKVPKNPHLLQPGMEGRLQQLIRREKRNLKLVEDIESPAKDVKEAKLVPELCCDICKTSVTCSEQMTMHLNGKKHLSKEKQHILKMMTGQSDEQEDMDEDEYIEEVEEGEKLVEQQQAEAKVDEQHENNGEQGDGTESWVDGTGDGWEQETTK